MVRFKTEHSEVIPIIVPVQGSLRTVNFYLVKSNQSLTLIDAGWNNDSCWESLLQSLKSKGLSLKDINEIILTHHHGDHVGLVDRIVDQHPIPVYTSALSIPRLKRERKYLEMRVRFFKTLYQESDCGRMGEKRINELMRAIETNKDQALQADLAEISSSHFRQLNVLEVPGHAHDHIALLDEESKWMFAGDVLLEHISSNALVEPDFNGNRLPTVVQQRDSLHKILERNPAIVFPGHGNIIENPQEVIVKRLQRMNEKAEKLLKLIQTGPTTANALAIGFYRKTYNDQFHLVMSEIIGYLDYLEANGMVNKDYVYGVWLYSAKDKHPQAYKVDYS